MTSPPPFVLHSPLLAFSTISLPQISTFKYSQKMISSIIHTLAWKHFFASLGYRIYGIKYQNICENIVKMQESSMLLFIVLMERCQSISGTSEKLWFFSPIVQWRGSGWKKTNRSEWIFLQISDWMLLRDFPSIVEERREWMIRRLQENRFKFTRNYVQLESRKTKISWRFWTEIDLVYGSGREKLKWKLIQKLKCDFNVVEKPGIVIEKLLNTYVEISRKMLDQHEEKSVGRLNWIISEKLEKVFRLFRHRWIIHQSDFQIFQILK